jgi:hypothetical protein
MKAKAESNFDGKEKLSMEAFTEDWNASQFWVWLLNKQEMDEWLLTPYSTVTRRQPS